MRLLIGLLVAVFSISSSFGAAETPKTFSADVWPILDRRCVVCHQSGGIGPMELTTYRQARPWAAAIREAVQTRTMPPWHAAPGAHRFRNDRSLSPEERATLVAWVDSGASEGVPLATKLPPPPNGGWKLGTPDLIVEVPGFIVPRSGLLPYSFLIVPLHLNRDTWVRAAEFQVDQRAAIHHMNAFVRPPNSSFLESFPANKVFIPTVAERGKRRDDERLFDRRELLLGYEPGYEARQWLDNGAKLIKAGSDIVLEMHYSPNGKEAIDHTKLGIYFAPEPPAYRILSIDTVRDLDLHIPPGESRYTSHAAMTLSAPVRLLSIQPHMHMRGSSMEIRALYPGGFQDLLLRVPKYDFGWQTTYVLSDPLPLPSGTRIESTATFDNSANNRFNPDPSAQVRWGDQTTDEMHIAFLELIIPATESAENISQERPRMIGAPQEHPNTASQ